MYISDYQYTHCELRGTLGLSAGPVRGSCTPKSLDSLFLPSRRSAIGLQEARQIWKMDRLSNLVIER